MTKITIELEEQFEVNKVVQFLNTNHLENSFVISEELEPRKGSVALIKKILKQYASKDLFKNIEDPVEFQRKLRNEWE